MRKTRAPRTVKERFSEAVYSTSPRVYPKYRRFWGKPRAIAPSELLPGDIMLSKGPVGMRNAVAGILTGSPFSHAAVYIGNGLFVDMSARRVRLVHAEPMLAAYREPFIFRAELSPAQQEKISENAVEMTRGRNYFSQPAASAIRRAEASRIRLKSPNKKGLACTSMVAKVFSDSGVVLVPGMHTSWVGPSHLIRSRKLKVVNA